MAARPPPICSCSEDCDFHLRECRKMLAMLDKGMINFEEYAFNFAIKLMSSCEQCTQTCIGDLPPGIVQPLHAYLRDFLEPIDFMPYAGFFICGRATEEEHREMKCILRPRYLRLYELVQERASRLGS